jgi:hypothetical protein
MTENVKAVPPEPVISEQALKEVKLAHYQYYKEIMRSALSETSKEMYVDFSDKFIRWLYGDYKPGTYHIMDRRPPKSENR